MTIFVIMGVAGCGKTTIGEHVSKAISLPFFDADDYHSPLNIAKMQSGVPLNEDDRMSWTASIISTIFAISKEGDVILACSALSKPTRSRLRAGFHGDCKFIHLQGDRITLKQRLSQREGHFFSVDLLASQFTALQMPRRALNLDIKQPIESLSQQVCDYIDAMKKATKS